MITQSIKMALKSITNNKMRSFLTMLGIIIGVYSLVVLVSLVQSSAKEVTDSINSLGSNLLSVTIVDDKNRPLRKADLKDVASLDEIGLVAPMATTEMLIKQSGDDKKRATVYGTTGSAFPIQNMSPAAGRLLKNVDEQNHSMVAVISSRTAEEFYEDGKALGEVITLGGLDYQIVGVLEKEENTMAAMMGETYDVYIPFSSLVRAGSEVSSDIIAFYATSADTTSMDGAEAALTTWLNGRFENDSDAYSLINQSSVMEVMDSVMGTMSLLLGGIAAISLLVGGIGIMNIMLVSVTERTREIGIRKAIGASREAIMLQFLIEAFIISIVGCIIGIILSGFTIVIINKVADVNYGLSPGVCLASVAFSMLVGLVFGIYPANKAARKKPIDALRYIG